MKDYRDYRTSRAIVIERPYEVNFREIELTEPGPDAYIARTTFSAISTGTDMKTYKGLQHPEQCWYPLVPGYETAGVVVAAGPEAGKGGGNSAVPDAFLKPGDRVMINECRKYRSVCSAWGGGAEYTVKDSNTTNDTFDYMVKIPDNVTDQEAVLSYLPCVALKGIRRLKLRAGEVVVVIGAGMVGISALQILKILCPGVIVVSVERNAFRRSIAQKYADYVFSDEEALKEIRELTDGKMADQLVECSGNPQVVGTLHRFVKEAGWHPDDVPAHIHLQGDYPERILLDHWHRWFVKHCTITMSCALAGGCKEQILNWISERKFDASGLPVETWPVSRCSEAYAYQAKMGEDVFKILFDWKE